MVGNVLVEKSLRGEDNMSRDRLLLELAEQGSFGCRVYTWAGPWISLGKQQDPRRDLLDPDTIPWVLRPTGGLAVLHGHDVTVGLAVPLPSIGTDLPIERLSRSVSTVYRALAEPIIRALRSCGSPAELGERTRFVSKPGRTADCFAHVSKNDIVNERTGQKVCGCALRLTQSAVLLQASIPTGRPLVDPASVIRGGQAYDCSRWDSDAFPAALEEELGSLASGAQ